jgi:hypothetical protein
MVPLLQIVILPIGNLIFLDKTPTITYKENMDQKNKRSINIQRIILFGVFGKFVVLPCLLASMHVISFKINA